MIKSGLILLPIKISMTTLGLPMVRYLLTRRFINIQLRFFKTLLLLLIVKSSCTFIQLFFKPMKVSYTKHHCIVYKAESNLNKKEIVYSDK